MKFVDKMKATVVAMYTDDDKTYLLVLGNWYLLPEENKEIVLVTDPELFKQLVEAYNNYQ